MSLMISENVRQLMASVIFGIEPFGITCLTWSRQFLLCALSLSYSHSLIAFASGEGSTPSTYSIPRLDDPASFSSTPVAPSAIALDDPFVLAVDVASSTGFNVL